MTTIEEIVERLRHATAMLEDADDRVDDLKETSERAHAEALKADAELVFAYPERDQWKETVRELQSQLIAAEGEPS